MDVLTLIGTVVGIIVSFITIHEFLLPFIKKHMPKNSNNVATRFIMLFENHGVHKNQIPQFFDHDLTIADIQDEKNLLPKLSEDILNDASKLFAVRREWLDGAEKKVYSEHDFYKHPKKFVIFLEKLSQESSENAMTGVLIKPKSFNENYPEALIIIQEVIGYIGEKTIYRFYLCTNWNFPYWKARAYLTACIAIAWKRKVYIHGIFMPMKSINKLACGETLLGWKGEGIYSLGRKSWDPEDMCDQPEKFLEGVDPEDNQHGIKLSLDLWLKLDHEGFMDSGFGQTARKDFETELDKL